MKLKSMTLLIGLLCGGISLAQGVHYDSVSVSFTDQINHIFEHVNLTEVDTSYGILYEYGLPIYNIEKFTGSQNDSNQTSYFGFGLAYATLYGMATDTNKRLPSPTTYRYVCDTVNKHSDVIPIALLHQSYYRIDSLAIEDSLFTRTSSQLLDVPDRSRSPYKLQSCFLATPVVHTIEDNCFSVVFKNEMIFDNTGKTILNLAVDLDDGNGLQSVNTNIPISAIYAEAGIKHLIIKVSYTDGSHYYSYSKIDVQFNNNLASLTGPYQTKDFTHHIDGEISDLPLGGEIEIGGGDIHVSLACGHTEIEKPFIWAEGYNPVVGSIDLNLDFDKIRQRINFTPFGAEKSLSEYLLEEGYDLIHLDYNHGGDYLPRTAEFIEEAIDWINAQKHAAGSNEKNVIIGQSMGGMCTRYALRTMEVNDKDHEVATYISFDVAHEGLNVPLGVNYLLRAIGELTIGGTGLSLFVPAVNDAVNLADLPASRTMLKYQPSPTGLYPVESLHNDYYEMQNFTLGMPQKCDVLSIANGSKLGTSGGQDFSSGDLLLHSNENLITVINAFGGLPLIGNPDEINSGSIIAWNVGSDVYVNLQVWAMSDLPTEPEFVYKAFISGSIIGLGTIALNEGALYSEYPGVDAAPGGLVYPHTLDGLEVPSGLQPDIYRLNGFCFTPTVSTLNYYGVSGDGFDDLYRTFLDPEDDLENNYTKDIENYLANELTATYGTPISFKNSEHTYFTDENAPFLLYHIVGFDMLEEKTVLTNDDIYHYGVGEIETTTNSEVSAPRRTKSTLSTSLTAQDDSKILVNASATDRIGLTPNTEYTDPNVPPFAKDNSHFSLRVIGNDNLCEAGDGVDIIVEENAEFIIGDNNLRTADVIVYYGNTITLRDGGKLVINKGSHLFMREGSQLIIEDGGTLIIEDQGTLVTLDESDFYYYDGAAIQLNGNDAKWEFAGQLHIMENAQFKPTHEGSNSGIIIVNSSEVAIVGETGSSFELFGDSEADELLLINDESILIADESIEIMRLVNCKVLFRSLVAAPIYSKCEFHSINVNYEVQSNMIDANTHAHVVLKNRGLVTSGEFHDVILKFDPNATMDGIGLRVMHTNFYTTYKKEDPLLIAEAGNFFIHDCEFNGYEDVALLSQGLTAYSTVSNSSFTGTHADYARGIFDYSASELKLTNSNLYVGNAGVWKVGGKLGLKCNIFHDYKFAGVFVSGCDLNMGTSGGSGYNIFSTMDKYNVYINNVQSCYIQNGFNTFDNVSEEPTIKGSIIVGGPYYTMLVGQRNKWNPANLTPSASEFNIVESGSSDPIGVLANTPQSASCGAAEPAKPYLDLDGNINSYFPIVSVTGATHSMRLDSAVSFAIESTRNWDESGSDLTAIERLHDILMHPYTTQQLADTTVKYYLDLAYSTMKYTIGYAIMDSTILISENVNAFSTPVQYYVDVLNELTAEDTILPNDYLIAFRLELDKAHLFRMIGHTDMGLSILQNTDLCPLDSAEQSEINRWKFVFEEEIAKRAATDFIPLTDTTFTDTSQYHQPTVTQIQDSYFGSVINSVSSITYRGCMGGSKAPKSVLNTSESSNLKIYPNPSNGEINIEYEIPAEHQGNLVIYSIEGKEIANFSIKEGRNAETIDIRFVQDGIYLYRLFVNELPTRSGRIIIRQ